MIQGQFFGKMIRVSVRKSELQRKSQSYSPKVRVTAGKSEPNCPKRVSESDFGGSAEKGLKAFLNPPKALDVFSPHLPCENPRTQFLAISMVFPQNLVDFQSSSIDRFSVIFNQLQTVFSISFQSVLISFNQFDSVKNAGIY